MQSVLMASSGRALESHGVVELVFVERTGAPMDVHGCDDDDLEDMMDCFDNQGGNHIHLSVPAGNRDKPWVE